MIDPKLLPKQNGVLATSSGMVGEARLRYDAVFAVSAVDGRIVCKKCLKSLTASGFGQHEQTIVPQTLDNLIEFFGATEAALRLYRQLPPVLNQPIMEALPHAFHDQDP